MGSETARQYLTIRRGNVVHLARPSDWELLCGRPMDYQARVAEQPWEQIPNVERCRRCEQVLMEEWGAWRRTMRPAA